MPVIAIAYVCSECGERYPSAGTCTRDGSAVIGTDDPLLGSEVGRYRLVRVLGQGGMGRVYAAVQPEVGSRVAIKVIAEQYAKDAELAERFFAEARAVNMIRHESIVNVLDLVRMSDGRPVIVMELIEGQTLREVERAGQVPIGGVVQVMIEVLSALAAAHEIGIVHRDLKPDNILITTGGRPKVLDFGIAKLINLPAGQTAPRTRTGVLLGTPEYMSPEQISGGGADARSDIYAAGVVLFEAITGQRPFDGASDFEVMLAHVETPPPSPRSLRPELPIELEQVILCALAKRPADRFASAGAMANALYQASVGLPAEQWRSLTLSGRVFPRRPPPPVEPSPAASLVTKVDRPEAPPTAPQSPSSRERARPDAHSSRSWLVPVLAAIAGAGVLALVLAVRSSGGSDRAIESNIPAAAGSAGQAVTIDAGGTTPIISSIAIEVAPLLVDAGVADASQTRRPDLAKVGNTGDAGVTARIAVPAGAGKDDVIPGRGQFSVPITNHKLEPVAFLPTALALAHRLESDAHLVAMEFKPVSPDGYMVFREAVSGDEARLVYRFFSPKRAAGPANDANQRWCHITVRIDPKGTQATVQRESISKCIDRNEQHPRCTAPYVWATAIANGFDPAVLGRLDWYRNVWRFYGERRGDRTYAEMPDDCVPGTPVPKLPAAQPVATRSGEGEFDDDRPVPPPPAPAAPNQDKPSGSFPTQIATDNFDPIAFIATARGLARKLEPDAELVELSVTVPPDGKVEFNVGGFVGTRTYLFRSVNRGAPVDPPHAWQCMVEIEIGNWGTAITRRTSSDACSNSLVKPPRCTFKNIWDKALARRADARRSTLTWDANQWRFDGYVDGNRTSFKFKDDCR